MTIKDPSLFVRPRSQNPDAPFYAPERDFGIQGLRMLAEVENLIVTGRIENLFDRYAAVGGSVDKDAAMTEFREAGQALMEYLADCHAKTYTGPKVSDWPEASKAISFTDAIAKVYAHPNQSAIQFLLSLIGRFALDAFFYGERSSSSVGQSLHQDYNRYLDHLSVIMLHGFTGEKQMSYLRGELSRVVGAMLSAGLTVGALQAVVDSSVASHLGE